MSAEFSPLPRGHESGKFDLGDGTQLHWEAVGAGRPIVFVHGLWASARFFRPQLAAIGRHHRAVALDLRGHGRSTMTPGGYTVPTLAADLRRFLDGMGLDRPILVGWSMGALVTWDYLRQFGTDGIAALVVADQPPTDFRFPEHEDALVGPEELGSWCDAVQTDRESFMRGVAASMFHVPPDTATIESMVAEMCAAPEAVATSMLVDQCLRNYWPVVADFRIPTMICAGGRGSQPAGWGEALCDLLEDAELHVFPDCGHALHWEGADHFNALLLRFIDRNPI